MQKILTCAQMRAADKHTIEELGVPSAELMERAGAAIADEAEKRLRASGGRSVLAVCGGGNNGGDGWCAARLLSERGFATAVYSFAEKLSSDCAAQRKKYRGKVYPSFPEEKFDLILDAVFGTGFRGTPEGAAAEAIARINAAGAFVLSADIPSGLNGDTGEAALAVRADVTVTIGERKWGLYLGDGADLCGEIVRAEIGIELPPAVYAVRPGAAAFADVFPPKKKNSHKGSYGRATLLAGSLRYSGAALLAAGGALRAGAGYTRLYCPASVFPYYVGKFPELILAPMPEEDGSFRPDEGALREVCGQSDAIAFGMGCGATPGVYGCARFLLRSFPGTLVLDADALNAVAEYGADVLKERAGAVILTPHLKEFSRLCGRSVDEVRAGGPALAQAFASEYGVTLLLKSNASIVTDGAQTALIAEGGPSLARGGSGDVLAGLVCALAARGAAPRKAAACAAFLLGRAGEIARERVGSEYSVVASDVIAAVPAAIAQLAKAE